MDFQFPPFHFGQLKHLEVCGTPGSFLHLETALIRDIDAREYLADELETENDERPEPILLFVLGAPNLGEILDMDFRACEITRPEAHRVHRSITVRLSPF